MNFSSFWPQKSTLWWPRFYASSKSLSHKLSFLCRLKPTPVISVVGLFDDIKNIRRTCKCPISRIVQTVVLRIRKREQAKWQWNVIVIGYHNCFVRVRCPVSPSWLPTQRRIHVRFEKCGDNIHGEREARAYIGIWWLCPQWGPGAKPLVGGSKSFGPLKLTKFQQFRHWFCH